MARAMRSPAGARRSAVMAAVTTAIARRSMTPITRRIRIRFPQDALQWNPSRRPCRQAVRGSAALRPPVRGFVPATGKVTRLRRGELKGAGNQNHYADRNRHRARQRRLPHLHLRQRNSQRERGHAQQDPHEEVRQRRPAQSASRDAVARAARDAADSVAVAPQHGHQRRQHHRHHHHDPHAKERHRDEATTAQASASRPSTSSSRRASACRPSPTWSCPRRS